MRLLQPIQSLLFALVATSAQGLSQEAPEPPPKGPPPVRVGVAPAGEIGALPPLTREIGRRAAKAFLQGKWTEARDAYLEILAADPDNPLTLANLGAVFLQMGKHDEACAHLEKALAGKPDLHAARVTLGLAYLQAGKSYLAVSTLSRAVNDQPRDARAHNYLAVAARERGWLAAAERELQLAVAAEPNFAEAHYNLALVYMEKAKPPVELARRHYRRAVDLGAPPDTELAAKIEAAKTD